MRFKMFCGVNLNRLLFLLYLFLVSLIGLVLLYDKPIYAPIAEVSNEIRTPIATIFGLIWIASIPFLIAAVLAEATEKILIRKKS
jgi:polyferredoxin